MAAEELPRYRAAWFALGWLLVLGVAVGSLLPSLPDVSAGVSDKFMHFAAYATLAFLFMGAVGRRHWRRTALGLLALGAALELAQATLTGARSGEWLDMAANAAGVSAGLVAAAAVPGNWCRQVEVLVGVGSARR
jgi:hypothetical protein